ncbi:MAG: hypothetical protein ACO1SX_08175 [Actinomycetota bacterium]
MTEQLAGLKSLERRAEENPLPVASPTPEPARYIDGVPDNLPAAAADALVWMELWKRHRHLSVNQLKAVDQQRFEACTAALERHLQPHLPAQFAGDEAESV